MSLQQRVATHYPRIQAIAARYGVQALWVFGSVARGEAEEESDLDLLVSLEPGRSLFDLGGLAYDLGELLDCRVDVVTVGALSGAFREAVLRDATPIEDLVA